MRILCIRGKNLASLAGEFEVRLDADPLSTSGVFAIVGNTGAGKSTLIDTMCLALFDATPRLEDRGGALVGREDDPTRLPANDVRSLLRKGAGAGYAEVEFVGMDGEVYVASWHTRRARGRATGAHQKQTMTLTVQATGERIGHGKKETKEAIVAKLGLTFEQARRSMLLAQGEFAAFLQAKGDERARLLEKVTGTFIYSRLSKAAFERAREAKHELDELRARAGEHQPLLEVERMALVADRDAKKAAAEAAKASHDGLTAADAWRVTDTTLRAEIGKAHAALEAAQQGVVDSREQRLELERTETAATHRSTVEAATRAKAQEKAARKHLEGTGVALTSAKAAEEKSRAVADEAKKHVEASAAALDAARPTLIEARALDAKLTPLAETATALTRRETELADAGAKLAIEHGELPSRIAAAKADVAGADAWFAEHAAQAQQVEKWESVRADLENLMALDAKRIAASAALRELEAEDGRAAEVQKAAALALAGAEAELASCTSVLELALADKEKVLGARDLDAERSQLARARERLDALGRTAQEHEETDTKLTKLSAELAEAQDLERDARLDVTQRTDDLQTLNAARDAQQAAHRTALAQLDLSGHRALLVPGEACPLCGSEEHPNAGLSGLSQLVDTFAAELAAAETVVREQVAQIAKSRASAEEQARRAVRTTATKATTTAKLEQLATHWAGDAKALALPESPGDAADALARLDAEQGRKATALDQDFAARKRCDAQISSGRSNLARAREARDARRAAAESATEERATVGKRVIAAQTGLDVWAQARQKREAAVDAVLEASWRSGFTAAAGAFISQGDALVAEWAACRQTRDAALVELDRLVVRRSEVGEQIAGMIPRFAEAKAAAAGKAAELEALREERRRLLGGRAAADVEQELAAARDRAKLHLESASVSHRGCAEHQAKAIHDAAAAQAAHATSIQEVLATTKLREAAVESTGFDLVEFVRLLAHDLAWIKATRASLAAIDAGVVRATTRIQERTESLTRHGEKRPDVDFETLDAQLEEARTVASEADQALLAVSTRLELDDHHRQETAALLAELTVADEKAQLWARMKSLIGSADGKRFRGFAQSLSLDILLTFSNAHLDRLQPRYQLQRVPGEDLELQVIDRDMGGEVRGVKSLSGGETFLASLALALGLASLTANSTTVDTLFIDEGFGALDADCLELALEVLDNLQESGRQVGVISHVGAIAERFTAQVRVEDLGGGRSRVRVVPETSSMTAATTPQPGARPLETS